jgi:ABC-type uncharacterized transport system permease subunit
MQILRYLMNFSFLILMYKLLIKYITHVSYRRVQYFTVLILQVWMLRVNTDFNIMYLITACQFIIKNIK